MTVWTVPALVVDVHDGDTATLVLDLGWRISYKTRVRVARINAPELNTPEGPVARDFAAGILLGAQVTFVSHSLDKYGRPLGDIRIEDLDFGAEMLRSGHAVEYR